MPQEEAERREEEEKGEEEVSQAGSESSREEEVKRELMEIMDEYAIQRIREALNHVVRWAQYRLRRMERDEGIRVNFEVKLESQDNGLPILTIKVTSYEILTASKLRRLIIQAIKVLSEEGLIGR